MMFGQLVRSLYFYTVCMGDVKLVFDGLPVPLATLCVFGSIP
jgi:hypothetical protein